eukprot:7471392-Pyramimonas_sp.AAC.1
MRFCTCLFDSSQGSPPSNHSRAACASVFSPVHHSDTLDTPSKSASCRVNDRNYAIKMSAFLSASPGRCLGCGAP